MNPTSEMRTLMVEHRTLRSVRSFELVHASLIAAVPALKPELAEMLTGGEESDVEAA
jgi:hypothetical protein